MKRGNLTNKTSTNWEEIGKNAAALIKITPEKLNYIEARGILCQELLFLLGGHIEFVKTSWKQFVLKILEVILPISPICRWYPSEDCVLEWIGYQSQGEQKVYRLIPKEGSTTVFFIDYNPEPPAGGGYVRPFFTVPQLNLDYFLQPPFDESNDNTKLEQLLRAGVVDKFAPIPMTSGARNRVKEIRMETWKGLWEEFSKHEKRI